MRRKIVLAVIACAVIVILFIVVSVFQATTRVTWNNRTGAGVKCLAEGIERYRNEHGRYPSSLQELLTGSEPEWTNYIHQSHLLNDQFNDKYEYQYLTNGFVIGVTRPGKWFMKGERLEKRY